MPKTIQLSNKKTIKTRQKCFNRPITKNTQAIKACNVISHQGNAD